MHPHDRRRGDPPSPLSVVLPNVTLTRAHKQTERVVTHIAVCMRNGSRCPKMFLLASRTKDPDLSMHERVIRFTSRAQNANITPNTPKCLLREGTGVCGVRHHLGEGQDLDGEEDRRHHGQN